jgi:NADP-dependent 3-hydroxy acid dehydrogenase YdfG
MAALSAKVAIVTGSTSGIGLNGFGDPAAIKGLRERLMGGREEQIGGRALFLCSESAAQMRDATLSIDGAWTGQ